jgi:hypothetical protein
MNVYGDGTSVDVDAPVKASSFVLHRLPQANWQSLFGEAARAVKMLYLRLAGMARIDGSWGW